MELKKHLCIRVIYDDDTWVARSIAVFVHSLRWFTTYPVLEHFVWDQCMFPRHRPALP